SHIPSRFRKYVFSPSLKTTSPFGFSSSAKTTWPLRVTGARYFLTKRIISPADQPTRPQRMAGNASNPKSRNALKITPIVPNTHGGQKATWSMGSFGILTFLVFGTFTSFGTGTGFGFGGSIGFTTSTGFTGSTGFTTTGFGAELHTSGARPPWCVADG